MPSDRVRLVLVDDRPMFCRGLALLLPAATDDRISVAETTDDASAAAGMVRRCHPDLAVVDLNLPAPGGLRAIAAIRLADGCSTTDMALTLHVSERTVKRLVASLLRRLRVSSRTEAAALAGRAGLLDRPA